MADDPRPRHGPGRRRDRRAAAGRRRRRRASRARRSRPSSSRGGRRSRARSARPSPSSPSRIRSSTSARTTPPRDLGLALRRGPEGGHPGDARARLRHRRRLPRDDDRSASSGRRASARPRRSSGPRRKTNITGRSSPLSTNPFMATLAPPDRAGAARLRDRVPHRRRGRARPALPVQDARGVRDADGGVRPRGAGRGAGRLAGDRLPGHDDRLRLRLAGHERRPTSGG